jgi:tetratricopeptide (TPR) repeat protein
MKLFIQKWSCLLIAFFLMIPMSVSAAENPNQFNPDQSYYGYRAGEGPLPLPKAYFLHIPDNIRKYNQLGIEHFIQSDYKTVLEYFRAARRLDPERAELLFNEALTLAELDRHAEATVAFEEAKHEAEVMGNGLILHSPTLQAHLGTNA